MFVNRELRTDSSNILEVMTLAIWADVEQVNSFYRNNSGVVNGAKLSLIIQRIQKLS